jgi:holo-[acyl-carrier protein] synthase
LPVEKFRLYGDTKMGVWGIGTDICDVERIARIIEQQGDRFLKKVFTEKEIAYCLPKHTSHECFAARFAAKEAFLKALGTGLRDGLNWKDLEVINDELGKPQLKTYRKCSEQVKDKNVLLSLSHTSGMALAFIIIENE